MAHTPGNLLARINYRASGLVPRPHDLYFTLMLESELRVWACWSDVSIRARWNGSRDERLALSQHQHKNRAFACVSSHASYLGGVGTRVSLCGEHWLLCWHVQQHGRLQPTPHSGGDQIRWYVHIYAPSFSLSRVSVQHYGGFCFVCLRVWSETVQFRDCQVSKTCALN